MLSKNNISKTMSLLKAIYKRRQIRYYNYLNVVSQFRTDIFYPMYMLPPRIGNDPFSVIVLVYDKSDSTFFNLGYYNYNEDKWETFEEESMDLRCWCFAPDPQKYWSSDIFEKIVNV